jgi:hypothetical protein
MLRANDLVPPSTVLIRRATLERIGGFQYVPDLCVTDFPTFLRISLEGIFHYTPKVMGFRRRHLGSATLNNMDMIANGAYQYMKRFIADYGIQVTRQEENQLNRIWRKSLSSNEFGKGRLDLVHREWAHARAHFERCLDPMQPRFLLASILGWTLSWARSDIEWVMRLFGRASITS